MNVKITYCTIRNYRPEALRVRDQLIKLDCNVQLKEGAGGAFDVVVNNTLRFSKKPAGSFPSTKEIIGIIQGIAN